MATEPKYGESVNHEIFMLLKCPLAVNITATALRHKLAHLGHKKLNFDCFECSFVNCFSVETCIDTSTSYKKHFTDIKSK